MRAVGGDTNMWLGVSQRSKQKAALLCEQGTKRL
jgi:hypothetical protein